MLLIPITYFPVTQSIYVNIYEVQTLDPFY